MARHHWPARAGDLDGKAPLGPAHAGGLDAARPVRPPPGLRLCDWLTNDSRIIPSYLIVMNFIPEP